MVRWMHNVRLEECHVRMFSKRRLQWFGHLERMEKNAWLSTIRKFGAIILLKNDRENWGVSSVKVRSHH